MSGPPQSDVAWAAEVWDRHLEALRALARAHLPSSEVEDALSEVFEVLVRARQNQDREERDFVLAVGSNVFQHVRRGVARFDRLKTARRWANAVPEPSPERADERLAHAELAQAVRRAVDELPPAQRQAIQAMQAGQSTEAIGAELGIPASTVRTRALHGRRRLRDALVLLLALLATAAAGFGARWVWHRLVAPPRVSPKVTQLGPPAHLPTTAGAPVAPAPESLQDAKPAPLTSAGLPRSQPPPARREGGRAPAPPDDQSLDSVFDLATKAQFSDQDFAAAAPLWEHYWKAAPPGALADEARFNWIVALFKSGRVESAAQEAKALKTLRTVPDRDAELDRIIAAAALP